MPRTRGQRVRRPGQKSKAGRVWRQVAPGTRYSVRRIVRTLRRWFDCISNCFVDDKRITINDDHRGSKNEAATEAVPKKYDYSAHNDIKPIINQDVGKPDAKPTQTLEQIKPPVKKTDLSKSPTGILLEGIVSTIITLPDNYIFSTYVSSDKILLRAGLHFLFIISFLEQMRNKDSGRCQDGVHRVQSPDRAPRRVQG